MSIFRPFYKLNDQASRRLQFRSSGKPALGGQKTLAVLVILENIFATIAAVHHVVDSSRIFNA